jgi:hypothetical protein
MKVRLARKFWSEILMAYISLQPVHIVISLIYQFYVCYFNFYLPWPSFSRFSPLRNWNPERGKAETPYVTLYTVIYECTVLRPAQEFFTYNETSPFASKRLQKGLCSALRAFEQGGIFIVPHLLWHGVSVFLVSSEGPPMALFSRLLRHTMGCGGSILTRILTGWYK